MANRRDVQHGTLALMIHRTLDVLGPLHGSRIARRIEETSGNRLALDYGTLDPALLKLEQEGCITGEWRPHRAGDRHASVVSGRRSAATPP